MPKVNYVKKIEERKQDIIEAFVAVYGEGKRKHIEKTLNNTHIFVVKSLGITLDEYKANGHFHNLSNQLLSSIIGVPVYELEKYANEFVEKYPTLQKIENELKEVFDIVNQKDVVDKTQQKAIIKENMAKFSRLTQQKVEEKEKLSAIFTVEHMRDIVSYHLLDSVGNAFASNEQILHNYIQLFYFLGAKINEKYKEDVREKELQELYLQCLDDEKIKASEITINAYIKKAQEIKDKIYDYLISNVKGAKEIETFINENKVLTKDMSAYLLFHGESVMAPCYVASKDSIDNFVFLQEDNLCDSILIHELTHAVEMMIDNKKYRQASIKIGILPYLCFIDHSPETLKEQCSLPYFDIQEEKTGYEVVLTEKEEEENIYCLNEVLTQFIAEKVCETLHKQSGKVLSTRKEETSTTDLVKVLRPILDSVEDKIIKSRLSKDWDALRKSIGKELYTRLNEFCNNMIDRIFISSFAVQYETHRNSKIMDLDILPTLLSNEEQWNNIYQKEESKYFLSQAKPLLDYMKSETYLEYVKKKKENTTEDE